MTEPSYDAMREKLQPDSKLRIFYNKGNPNNALAHVRAIIDDDWIVWKAWSRRKQRWQYFIDYIYFFWILDKNGRLTKL